MRYTAEEIMEVYRMLSEEQLDIRSVTLSVNTLFAIAGNLEATLKRLESLGGTLERFVKVVNEERKPNHKVKNRVGKKVKNREAKTEENKDRNQERKDRAEKRMKGKES